MSYLHLQVVQWFPGQLRTPHAIQNPRKKSTVVGKGSRNRDLRNARHAGLTMQDWVFLLQSRGKMVSSASEQRKTMTENRMHRADRCPQNFTQEINARAS